MSKRFERTYTLPSTTSNESDASGGNSSLVEDRSKERRSMNLYRLHKSPNALRNALKLSLFICVALKIFFTIIPSFLNQSVYQGTISASKGKPLSGNVELSVVILTYNKPELLGALLPSIIRQNPGNFEVIVVDNGCIPGTKKLLFGTFSNNAKANNIPFKYLPLCDNPGYSVGNNKGVELANKESKWIIFLNDDIILNDGSFFDRMMSLGETKENAGGVVCKILNEDGSKVYESGSIVWNDGNAAGVGRNSDDVDAPNLSYAKPVDYGSGACLMIKKEIFIDRHGFDYQLFTNYYEDTDLQMHIQHKIHKEIWFQPGAVAFHSEHASFSKSNARELMKDASYIFHKKWKSKLERTHLLNPHKFTEHKKSLQFMKAADLRARDPMKANILWLEQAAPNPENGSGFGRAFDNLSVAAELGHRITLVLQEKLTSDWCDAICRNRISDLGVEMITGDWEDYVNQFIEFYDIVYVSRPAIFQMTYKKWQDAYKKHSFMLIYDCEALWYKRDELLMSLLQSEDISNFPGGVHYFRLDNKEMDMDLVNLEIKHAVESELKMIQMADSVFAVSERETDVILKALPDTDIHSIGHINSVDKSNLTKSFQERHGILFLASYSDSMYYNGDAIWYFIKEVFPLVLAESESSIPLTIAGRQIPKTLRNLVMKDGLLSRNVIFCESVSDIIELHNNARIFIAPHQYGSGIQYKVSKAFSLGVPTVLSKFTASSFGIKEEDQIGCVGESAIAMKECILDLNGSSKKWEKARDNELQFIKLTHKRSDVLRVFGKVIQTNLKKIKDIRREGSMHKMAHSLLRTRIAEATEPCPEGERYYGIKYPDVKEAVAEGIFESNFFHYHNFGRSEGRKYLCFQYKSYIDDPAELCPEGEEAYARDYPGVKFAVSAGDFESMFSHYKLLGKDEGKEYKCLDKFSYINYPTELCPEGEEAYARDYPGVKSAVSAGDFESMFSHYKLLGKDEGKQYLCTGDNTELNDPVEPCPEGEEAYARNYPDVKEAVLEGIFESMFSHYKLFGKDEGKEYLCPDKNSYSNDSVEPCPEGEEAYALNYPDVKNAVDAGIFESMYSHYHNHGRFEGKKYICFEYNSYIDDPTEPCPEGEEAYGNRYPDVKEAVAMHIYESMFSHYQSFGKQEKKEYLCLKNLTQ